MKKVGRKACFDDQFNSLINVGDVVYLSGEYTSNQVKCCTHNYVHNKLRNPCGKVLSYKKMPTGDHRVMLTEFMV